ncbi:MAG: AmmeMemoRadiSam system protein B [Thermoplasmata archaeon]|nr:AmmeMemoRadiSam system protein B [Thermoplasmata archaeon]
MRYASVAGQFYSGTEAALLKELEDCFNHELGPGKVPELNKSGERRIRGIVSPHAGFMYSGPIAAHGFAALAEDGFPDVFVILGPNHHGLGSGVAITTHDFETPLGTMQNDKELARKIRTGIVDDSMLAHRHEHSIEVQLPFIQFFARDRKFVPVSMLMQDHKSATQVGKSVRDAIGDRDAVIIASTDFSHYISPEAAKEKDMLAIDRILDLDTKGLYDTVRKNRITMCGFGPVIAMLEAVQGSEAELLKYANSGDVKPMAEVVGYASIVVR